MGRYTKQHSWGSSRERVEASETNLEPCPLSITVEP